MHTCSLAFTGACLFWLGLNVRFCEGEIESVSTQGLTGKIQNHNKRLHYRVQSYVLMAVFSLKVLFCFLNNLLKGGAKVYSQHFISNRGFTLEKAVIAVLANAAAANCLFAVTSAWTLTSTNASRPISVFSFLQHLNL